jgi:hypothetical protein
MSTVLSTTWATFGVDVSQSISLAAFQCLKSKFFSIVIGNWCHEQLRSLKSRIYICSFLYIGNGYDFAVARVYEEIGQLDPNGAQTIKNAWTGGKAHVDGYIYPCVRCGNTATQVLNFLFS